MKLVKKILCSFLILTLVFSTIGCNHNKSNVDNLTNYTIRANLDDKKMLLSCDMRVEYTNNTKAILNELCLNLYPNAFRQNAKFKPVEQKDIPSAFCNGLSYGDIKIKSVKIDNKESEFIIKGDDENILSIPINELAPYDRITFTIDFIVNIPNVKHRLGYIDDVINLGNFYPIMCVYENGFLSYPYYSNGDPFYSECANYDFSISVPKKYRVACSGDCTTIEDNDNIIVNSKINNIRDFACVVGDFKYEEDEVDGVKIKYYYLNDTKARQSVEVAKDSITTFSNLYGKYPYKTLSVVQTNFLYGGMEYPTLIYVSNALNESFHNEVIVHETAHQWWYSLVGNNQIMDAWMDEGLTEFSTSYFYKVNDKYNVSYDKRIADALSGYILYNEHFNTDHRNNAMSKNLGEYLNSLEYSYFVYVQGELMFSQLLDIMGEEKFFNALKYYVTTYSNKQAKPDDMIACFEKSSKMRLSSYFNSWLSGNVKMFAN